MIVLIKLPLPSPLHGQWSVRAHTRTHVHTLTFLHHSPGHCELRGVVSCSFAFCLPGFLSHSDEVLSLFDSHLGVSAFCDPLFLTCTKANIREGNERWILACTILWAEKQANKEEHCTDPTGHNCSIWLALGFLIFSLVRDHYQANFNSTETLNSNLGFLFFFFFTICLEHWNTRMIFCKINKNRECFYAIKYTRY